MKPWGNEDVLKTDIAMGNGEGVEMVNCK